MPLRYPPASNDREFDLPVGTGIQKWNGDGHSRMNVEKKARRQGRRGGALQFVDNAASPPEYICVKPVNIADHTVPSQPITGIALVGGFAGSDSQCTQGASGRGRSFPRTRDLRIGGESAARAPSCKVATRECDVPHRWKVIVGVTLATGSLEFCLPDSFRPDREAERQ